MINKEQHISIGISTSCLKNKFQLNKLLQFEPDIVEFYNYPASFLSEIELFCGTNNIKPALHVPVPNLSTTPLRKFCPSGPDLEAQQQAIKHTCATIRFAAQINAKHVVVHYPTPYPDLDPTLTEEIINTFWEPVLTLSNALQVQIIIENMTTHKVFHTSNDYSKLIGNLSPIGLCFDIGHAWMRNSDLDVLSFIHDCNNQILSCHIYDLERNETGGFNRSFWTSEKKNQNHMNLSYFLDEMAKVLDTCPVMILEPPPLSDTELPKAASYIPAFRAELKKRFNRKIVLK